VIGFAQDAIRKLIAHRLGREAKVIAGLGKTGPTTIGELVKVVYDDTRPALQPVAERSLLAHLEKLVHDGQVAQDGDRWALT
jgi:hypothetical protein